VSVIIGSIASGLVIIATFIAITQLYMEINEMYEETMTEMATFQV